MTCSLSAFLANLALCLPRCYTSGVPNPGQLSLKINRKHGLHSFESAGQQSTVATKSLYNYWSAAAKLFVYGGWRVSVVLWGQWGETLKCIRALLYNKAGGLKQDMTGVSRVVFPVIDSATFVLPKALCPANEDRSASSGVILSPGYPSNYPNSQTCSWLLRMLPGNLQGPVRMHVRDIRGHVSTNDCLCWTNTL